MQVRFFGGSFHQRCLTVAGELRDLPRALDNPFGDQGETYLRQVCRMRDHEGAIFVLKGYSLSPDDLTSISGEPIAVTYAA